MGSTGTKEKNDNKRDAEKGYISKRNAKHIFDYKFEPEQKGQETPLENLQEKGKDMKLEFIDYTDLANEVQVKGSFDNFGQAHPMRRAEKREARHQRWICQIKASKEIHKFYFLVDGKITVSRDYKVSHEEEINQNFNCIDLRDNNREKDQAKTNTNLKNYWSQNFEQVSEFMKDQTIPKLPEIQKTHQCNKEVLEPRPHLSPHGQEVKGESEQLNQDQSVQRMKPNHTQLDHTGFTKPKDNLCVQALSNRVRNKTLTIFYQTKKTNGNNTLNFQDSTKKTKSEIIIDKKIEESV